jgi:hypothetical protein
MAEKSLSTIAKELYQGFGRNPANRELAKTLTLRAPIVEEFNPAYFIPRGINTLRNADYSALKGLLMRDYMKSATPREDIDRGLSAAGDVLMGGLDVSPLAALKGPVKAGAKYAGRELGPVANRRMEQAMDDLGLRLNIVKPEGGQWESDTAAKLQRNLTDRYNNDDISKWLQTTGRKYIMNRSGSPSDEIRLLADQGITHLSPSELVTGFEQTDREIMKDVIKERVKAGYPNLGLSDTDFGSRWELRADAMIQPFKAEDFLYSSNMRREMPWLEKIDPQTPVYGHTLSDTPEHLGMNKLADALRYEIDAGRLRPEQLNKVSIGDAVKLAHQQRLAREAASEEILQALPKVKEYPEGFTWQELIHEDPATLDMILKREGDTMQNCIGGYCSDVIEDGTRLFSLRDPAGKPHVNIEMKPESVVFSDIAENIGYEKAEELLTEYTPKEIISMYPELRKYRINQVKGKQNAAPVEDYMPYVQDFVMNPVTGRPYSEIRDLQNTGLIDLNRLREHGLFDLSTPGARGRDINAELSRIYPAEVDKFGGRTLSGQYGVRIPTFDMMRGVVQEMPGNYTSPAKLIEYLQSVEPRPVEQGYSKYWQNVDSPKEFAEGGLVDSDDIDYDEAYEFIDSSEGFAEGGVVDKIARAGRKGQYKIAELVGLRPEVEFATEIPERYFPANEQHNARGDAMRHMLLQAQLMQKYGETPAKVIGWLHENLSGPQGDAEKAMDVYNDRLGRDIGRVAKDKADMAYRALQAIEKNQAKTLTKEQMGEGYAEGGLVYNEEYSDYDSLYEFK